MSVCTFEQLLRREAPSGKSARVFHVHVPKAAGSTLDVLFRQNGYEVRLFGPLDPPWNLTLKADERTLFSGHYRLNHPVFRIFSPPHVRMSVLREPVDRMISLYNFTLRREMAPWHTDITRGEMSFIDFTANMVREFGQQYTYFDSTGDGAVVAPIGTSTRQDCLRNLLEEISFFGLSQHFDELVIMTGHLLGLRSLLVESHNVTRDIPVVSAVPAKKHLLPDERDALNEMLSDDIWFYEQAVQAYDARINAPPLRDVIREAKPLLRQGQQVLNELLEVTGRQYAQTQGGAEAATTISGIAHDPGHAKRR